LWTNDLNKIISSLNLLKENDIDFQKKIKVIYGDYDNKGNIDVIELKNKENIILKNFVKIKCMTYEEIWNLKKNILFDFVNTYKLIPKQTEYFNNINISKKIIPNNTINL
jgi:hypothetical protein